jgi:hypothetical protein
MKKITIAIAIFTVMAFAATGAFAATKLTVANATGTTGIPVAVTVSDPVGIAGAAFTLSYDTTKLSVTNVTSSFFGTFSSMGYDSTDGLSDGKVDTYSSPVVVNPAEGGKITKIAAARPTGGTAADGTTLFTLTVDIIDATAETGATFPITITPTTLSNEAAGYNKDGEPIDLIIKEDYTAALSKTDATAAGNITAGTVTKGTTYTKGDPVAPFDKKPDLDDLLYAIEMMTAQSPDTTSSGYKACDIDDKNGVDLDDLLAMIDLMLAP